MALRILGGRVPEGLQWRTYGEMGYHSPNVVDDHSRKKGQHGKASMVVVEDPVIEEEDRDLGEGETKLIEECSDPKCLSIGVKLGQN